jgi:phage virion morphogenesis protein
MAGDVVGLDELEQRLDALLRDVSPSERVRLAHQLGRELRVSQARRIRANANPDGSAFVPRKERPPLRSKVGRLKRRRKTGPMFRKMGQANALNWEASADGVSVGYADAALSRIARVSQFGLVDRVARYPGAPEAAYPERRLLGLTAADRGHILDLVLQKLTK